MNMNKKCSIEGCEGNTESYGLCSKHYQKMRFDKMKTGEWDAIKRGFRTKCEIEGCESKHLANGLCQRHYSLMIRKDNWKFLVDRYLKDGVRCPKCKKEVLIQVMDAHHLDPNKKEYVISEVMNSSTLQKNASLLAELDNCQLLCPRCHQNTHFDPKFSHEETYTIANKKKGRQIDNRKKMVREIYGEVCIDCKDWLYPKEMDFHHRDPEFKEGRLSDMFRIASKEAILAEVAKCDILCRTCHRIRHISVEELALLPQIRTKYEVRQAI